MLFISFYYSKLGQSFSKASPINEQLHVSRHRGLSSGKAVSKTP